MSRRNMLAELGIAGAAAASAPILSSCAVGGRAAAPNGADTVTGGFDWRKAAGYAQFGDRYRDMARTLGFEGHIAWAEAMP
jgi:hypothetical protein